MVSETNCLKNIQQKERKRLIAQQASLSKFPWRWFAPFSPKGNFCAWLVLIVTCVTAYYSFAFKISVFPSGTIDPSNPFATPFILKNDSWLWINNVRPYRVIIHKVNNYSCNINTNLVVPPISQLTAGETTTFTLPVAELEYTKAPINYLNIEIVVFYYAAFIPFYEKENHTRFVTIQSKDGKLQWTPKAISE